MVHMYFREECSQQKAVVCSKTSTAGKKRSLMEKDTKSKT